MWFFQCNLTGLGQRKASREGDQRRRRSRSEEKSLHKKDTRKRLRKKWQIFDRRVSIRKKERQKTMRGRVLNLVENIYKKISPILPPNTHACQLIFCWILARKIVLLFSWTWITTYLYSIGGVSEDWLDRTIISVHAHDGWWWWWWYWYGPKLSAQVSHPRKSCCEQGWKSVVKSD